MQPWWGDTTWHQTVTSKPTMQRTFPSLCRGIGHGLVKKLLERSNKVIATARVPQDAQQLQQLAARNSNLIVAALDVSQPDSITQFAAEVKKHTQHVDVSQSQQAAVCMALSQSGCTVYCPSFSPSGESPSSREVQAAEGGRK